MRSTLDMAYSFMPQNEKEYEAVLFVDEAIREKVEYHLAALARALCGPKNMNIEYAGPSDTDRFEHTEHKQDNLGGWHELTSRYKYRILFGHNREYTVYGTNLTQAYLRLIDWFAGDCMCFPCMGAYSLGI